MWRMIELRLRSRLALFAGLYAGCLVVAAVLALAKPTLRSPERFAVLAGAFSLVVAFIVHTVVLAFDGRESRAALHFALPIPRAELFAHRLLEPVLPTLALSLVTLALAALARLLAGGSVDAEILVFWLALTAMMLSFGQVHLFVDEVQHHLSWGLVLVAAVTVTIALCGAIFSFVLGAFALTAGKELPTVVVLMGQAEVIFSFLAITLLLAGLNRLLLARRRSFLD